MADFEQTERRQGGKYVYSPGENNAPDPMEGLVGENLKTYLGTSPGPPIIEEIKAWADILMTLKDGLPKPYDNSIILEKLSKIERRSGQDLSGLKQCCPPSAEVREAKELKPFIFGILDRVVEIGGISNYVERYR